MKILIAGEESQAVTKEFRELGHEAYSCDILDCSGGHPEWHIKDDMFNHLSNDWDFIGAHPECTYLTNSGVCWLYNKDKSKNIDRWIKLELAVNIFNKIKSKIKKGYLENPIPHKYARDGFYSVLTGKWVKGIGKYSQIIQPYQYGHLERKATCLWIIGDLPLLKETNNVYEKMKLLPKKEQQRIHYLPPSKDRSKLRAKTFKGPAQAMAEQWGGRIENT
jgi:hypothetical protein